MKMKFLLSVLVPLALAFAVTAHAEVNIALVNGNSAHTQAPALTGFKNTTAEMVQLADRNAVEAAKIKQETVYWQSIMNSKNPADYEDFLSKFPNGTFASLAKRRLEALRTGAAKPENRRAEPVRKRELILSIYNQLKGRGFSRNESWTFVQENPRGYTPEQIERDASHCKYRTRIQRNYTQIKLDPDKAKIYMTYGLDRTLSFISVPRYLTNWDDKKRSKCRLYAYSAGKVLLADATLSIEKDSKDDGPFRLMHFPTQCRRGGSTCVQQEFTRCLTFNRGKIYLRDYCDSENPLKIYQK